MELLTKAKGLFRSKETSDVEYLDTRVDIDLGNKKKSGGLEFNPDSLERALKELDVGLEKEGNSLALAPAGLLEGVFKNIFVRNPNTTFGEEVMKVKKALWGVSSPLAYGRHVNLDVREAASHILGRFLPRVSMIAEKRGDQELKSLADKLAEKNEVLALPPEKTAKMFGIKYAIPAVAGVVAGLGANQVSAAEVAKVDEMLTDAQEDLKDRAVRAAANKLGLAGRKAKANKSTRQQGQVCELPAESKVPAQQQKTTGKEEGVVVHPLSIEMPIDEESKVAGSRVITVELMPGVDLMLAQVDGALKQEVNEVPAGSIVPGHAVALLGDLEFSGNQVKMEGGEAIAVADVNSLSEPLNLRVSKLSNDRYITTYDIPTVIHKETVRKLCEWDKLDHNAIEALGDTVEGTLTVTQIYDDQGNLVNTVIKFRAPHFGEYSKDSQADSVKELPVTGFDQLVVFNPETGKYLDLTPELSTSFLVDGKLASVGGGRIPEAPAGVEFKTQEEVVDEFTEETGKSILMTRDKVVVMMSKGEMQKGVEVKTYLYKEDTSKEIPILFYRVDVFPIGWRYEEDAESGLIRIVLECLNPNLKDIGSSQEETLSFDVGYVDEGGIPRAIGFFSDMRRKTNLYSMDRPADEFLDMIVAEGGPVALGIAVQGKGNFQLSLENASDVMPTCSSRGHYGLTCEVLVDLLNDPSNPFNFFSEADDLKKLIKGYSNDPTNNFQLLEAYIREKGLDRFVAYSLRAGEDR